jgi:hypothetical protein
MTPPQGAKFFILDPICLYINNRNLKHAEKGAGAASIAAGGEVK